MDNADDMIGCIVVERPPSASFRRAVAYPDVQRLVLFAALFALTLAPVATNPIPAMVDYVNHLARMYELAAPRSLYYHADWKLYPNLAMDLIVPLMARWTSVELATRMFLLASQILVVTGSIAIEWRVQRRFGVAGFVAVLYLFNVPFAWGFLNFEFALGVALWGIAGWLEVRERSWSARLLVHTLFAAALFAAHLFALGLYGAAIGLYELWAARRGAHPLRRLLAMAVLLAAPVTALFLAMAATGGSAGGSANSWQLGMKPIWPFLVLNGDNAFVAIGGSMLLAAFVHASVKRGEIAFVGAGATIALGFLTLYLVIPGMMLDTAFADIRVLVGAAMILPAFVSVSFDVKQARVAAVLVSGLTIVNVASIESVWRGYQPVYRAMIASFAKLGSQPRVLVAETGGVDDPPLLDLAAYPIRHAPTLAVPYVGAFVPTLFTTKGKQPLDVAPALVALSNSNGGPVPLSMLRDVEEGRPGASFVEHWPVDFDYVYVLGKDANEPVPKHLELLERSQQFALYRVRRPAGAGLSAPASP